MITKEEAKEKLRELIKDFSEGEKYWDTKSEETIKKQFIEPLFENVLGWNRKDILMEEQIQRKRADYIFKNGNQEVLIVEAKKTDVPLTEEEGRQAVSYAYHRKIKFAVLTNFKHLRVYHALSNIKNIDKNLLKINNNYFRLEFKDFLDKFDILWLLSKESFEKKEINKLLSARDEKINKPIDEAILNDLLNIREWLSKELKSKKNYLEKETIDEIIQILVDRLIFIRSVEDRELEPMNYLRSLESDVRQQRTKLQLFPYLLEKFDEFNSKYDSKLFERGLLEKEGTFSDDVLRKVILALYFGSENNQDRYLFDQIPGDLFGSIYEQYLGTVLSGTEKRIKLEGGTGKRKKMGIYYTPSYIVDYIVKNTVGEYIKDKSIDDILKVKIIDPACGSGSFLVRAFQEVCDKIGELLKNNNKSEKATFKEYKNRLSLAQKITILLNCVYGVDLDEKAIELARLNLLLKVLDGENQETRKMLLPHLENNIKCGNSLIEDSKISDRAFNWNAQFKDVFADGGFNVVVGNPPYGAGLSQEQREFFIKNYLHRDKDINTFILFFEKSESIMKKGGNLGFIVPKNIIKTDDYTNMRKFILDNFSIKSIVDSGESFKDVTGEMVILIFSKVIDSKNSLKILKIEKNKFVEKGILKQNEFLESDKFRFNLSTDTSNKKILEKIKSDEKLENFVKIYRGIETGKKDNLIREKKPTIEFKEILAGKDLDRYVVRNIRYIDYVPNKINFKDERMYNQAKIIIRKIADHIHATLDKNNLYTTQGVYILNKNGDLPLDFLLGVINSKLIHYYYELVFNMGSHLTTNVTIENVKNLPIRLPSSNQEKKIISLVNQMLEFQKKYHEDKTAGNEKERLKGQIENTDYEINEEVYKLYGITEEEKKIIEESLK